MTVGMIIAIILGWINHPEAIDRDKIPAACALIKRAVLAGDAD